MPHYPYFIIGGGMTAAAAVDGIREVDPAAAIGLVGSEPYQPYNRPPLSKGLWKGDNLDSIWRGTEAQGAAMHLGRTIRTLEPQTKRAVDDQGVVYTFDKCLIATGGTPRRLPFGGDDIIYYRTLEDFRTLRTLASERERFAVIGGGFIGAEVAAALAMNGKQVVMLFPEEGIGARIYPRDLALSLNDYYREKGVDVRAGVSANGMERRGNGFALRTESGEIVVDGVVAGIGIQPNVELAQQAGLGVDNGIIVDEYLTTSFPDVYAAGDVANFANPALGGRMRVEHEDNANTMGRLAGMAMIGQRQAYTHLPFFYSDLFDLGYEAVGELDARLETFSDWKEPFREGVVYYLKDGRVRGVLLWNTWDQVDNARELIASAGPYSAANLKGRLPRE